MAATPGETPSQEIDATIQELDDWRGKTLARLRTLIKQADPKVVEDVKWGDVPVWYHDGFLCTGETYKDVVKLTFAQGASMETHGLFNSSLDAGTGARSTSARARNRRGGSKATVGAAVALNESKD